jgi:hypothetical protein
LPSGGLVLASGFQAALGMGNYYAFSDSTQGGTSTASVATSNLCGCGISGVLGGLTSYGGGIGCTINQSAPIDPAALGIGIHYNLGTLPSGPDAIFLTVNNGADEFDCPISTATGTCLWPAFFDATSNMDYLRTAPTGATHVNVLVGAGSQVEPWQLCIVSLAIVGSGSSGIGDPCFKDQDCVSSTCTGIGGGLGWCTEACAPTSTCDGNYSSNNAQNNPNVCVSSLCTPTCAAESDCVPVGADCIGGICVTRTGTAGIGDRCYANSACASHSCGALGFCTSECTAAADCYGNYPKHENAQGTANACEPVDSLNSSCFPECTQPSDCAMFPGSSCDAVDGGPSICSL